MERIVYRCEFKFKNTLLSARSRFGVSAFNKGFWVTADLKYTSGEKAKYWVPPHKIKYIAKEFVKD